MTGLIVLAVIALALLAALEPNRRRSAGPVVRLAGSSDVEDRDMCRLNLDLVALAGGAEAAAVPPAARRSHLEGRMHNPFHGHRVA